MITCITKSVVGARVDDQYSSSRIRIHIRRFKSVALNRVYFSYFLYVVDELMHEVDEMLQGGGQADPPGDVASFAFKEFDLKKKIAVFAVFETIMIYLFTKLYSLNH